LPLLKFQPSYNFFGCNLYGWWSVIK